MRIKDAINKNSMKKNKTGKYFPKVISKKQLSETGMAIVLILLLIGFLTQKIIFYKIAIPVLILDMIIPIVYYPFAILWFGFSEILGIITSKVLLSIIYFIFVLPVAVFRRLMRKDSLQINNFKKSKNSVFITRNITFTSAEIEKPY